MYAKADAIKNIAGVDAKDVEDYIKYESISHAKKQLISTSLGGPILKT